MKTNVTKLLLISILSLFISRFTSAQQGTLYGTVTDAESGEALISATVRVGDLGVVTDPEGRYRFDYQAGEQEVVVSYLGYEELRQQVSISAEAPREYNFQLRSATTLLQTATVTSGKYAKPLSEVTVSMEVIQPRLIEASNTATADEILSKIPGVSIAEGQANIRGGSGWSYGAGSRVLLLVDDIPALQADAGFPNWSDIPVENIEQVEVIKGAASALYGSSAMNGIINIRTAYAKSEPETKVSAFYTLYGAPSDADKKWWSASPFQRGLSLAHRQKFDQLDLVLGAFGYELESFRADTEDRFARLNFNTRYRFNDRLSAGVAGNFNLGESENYFYWRSTECACGSFQGDSTTFSDRQRFRYTIDPFLTYFDRAGNRHKVLGRYYGINNNVDNNQDNSSQLIYGEYQFQREFEGVDLVLTTGLVGSLAFSQAELYGDTTYRIGNSAAYLQLDKKFFNKLNVSAGLRYERNAINSPDSIVILEETLASGRSVEAKPVFRLGLNYQLAEYSFLRASWGQGYRFPTLAEKFINTQAGSLNITPNPELTSETGWTVEVGIKQGFRIGDFNGFVDLSLFQSEYTNMMEFELREVRFDVVGPDVIFQPIFQSSNVGDTRIRGVELSLGGQGKIGDLLVNLIGGYTYTDPRFQEFDLSGKDIPYPLSDTVTAGQRNARGSSADTDVLKYRSRHLVKFDLELNWKKFTLAFAANHESHIKAIDWVFTLLPIQLEEYRQANNRGYRTFNMRLGYDIREGLRVTLLGKNLFNEEYTLRPGLLEAPINGTLRVDWKF
ncbi:MAG: TonB-dependent receptor [Bacteroidota bacterium]